MFFKIRIFFSFGSSASQASSKRICLQPGKVNQNQIISQSPMEDQWIADVENGFRNQNVNSIRRSEKVSIYKVPEFLVQVKQSAYVPQMVSLGPLHHVANPEMLPHKLHATRKMFEFMTKEELEEQVIGHILALVPTVRKCYQYHIEYQDRRLAWMLTLDACFILEIFRALGTDTKSDQCLFDRNTIEYTAYPIITDILMLENQIPLCVLLKILELKGKDKNDKATPLTELCELVAGARIARFFYPFKETDPPLKKIPGAQKSKHLLDLIRMYVIHPFQLHEDEETEQPASEIPMYIIHPCQLHQDTDQPWPVLVQPCPDPPKREIIIPSASELRRSGIKFTKMEGNFMEISIKRNQFHLPRIRISSSVETLLRNLMALEI